MSLPLRYLANTNIDIQELSDAQLSRLSYDLRIRFANQVDNNGAGRILVGGGTNFGSASDTKRTQVTSAPHPHSFPGASTGTTTVTTYQYGQTLPTAQTVDYSNSFVYYNNIDAATGEFIQAPEAGILNGVLNDVFNEMRSGDELGTYRVAVSSPGTGWVNKGTWFVDTVYPSALRTTYTLWFKNSGVTVPSNAGLVEVLGMTADGDLQEISQTNGSPLHNLLYGVMQNQLLKSTTSPLRYDIGSGANRGTFVNTQLSGTSTNNQQSGPDHYTTTATPNGSAVTVNSFFLGIH